MNTQTIPRFGRRGRTTPTDDGFTLIELIVVVIIIGILAAIAIPIFSNQRQRGVDATVTAQVRHVVDAIETAMIDGLGVIDGSHTAGSVTIGASTVDVPTTDGVRWIATGAGLEYCVSGWHDDTNRYTSSSPLIWDSSAGGFLPPGAECGSGTPGDPGDPGDGGGGGGGPLPPGDGGGGGASGGVFAFTLDLAQAGCRDHTVRAPVMGATSGTIDWGDGTVEPLTPTGEHTYSTPGPHQVTITGQFERLTFTPTLVVAESDAACLASVDAWAGDTGTVSLEQAFMWAQSLTAVPPLPDELQITSLRRAFWQTRIESGLETWDTSNVTDMYGTFAMVPTAIGDLSGWDTSSVTDMSRMFEGAWRFDEDLSGWDTSSVANWDGFDEGAIAWQAHHKPVLS